MQPKYQLGRLPEKLWIAECKITAWTEENKFIPKVSLIGMTWLDVWGLRFWVLLWRGDGGLVYCLEGKMFL